MTRHTGISSNLLREATLKHFEGRTKLVKKLGSLDDKGQTGELWERLVKESPSVLRRAGLMQKGDHPQPPGKPGEGNGGGGPRSEPPPTDPDAKRREILAGLEPADRKAYLSYHYAETMAERGLQDRDAHKRLQENEIDANRGDPGELTDYALPTFDTWARQLRNAREPLGEQKHTPRARRVTGRSIVTGGEIEHQKRDDD